MIQQSPGGRGRDNPDDRPELTRTGNGQGFNGSPQPTVGIEIELPLLDRETGALSPGSRRVLRACEDEGISGVSAELMQSMLEVRTEKCESVLEARDQLLSRTRRVRNLATSLGYDLAMLGTHPSAKATENVLFPDERYNLAENRMAWMIYHRVTFGMHVHVGVRSGDEAISLINILVQYLSHLLALSANSAYWQGIDTGLASVRAALYGLVPHAGVPRYFSNWKEFRGYCQIMRDCKILQSHRDVKWDIRPRADLGTIEFRICDVPATMGHVLGIAALARCLVISTQRLLDERPQVRTGDARRQWIAVENKWLATRFGLDAVYISAPAGRRRSLRQEVGELIERFTAADGIARTGPAAGDDRFLQGLGSMDKFISGSERQRRLYREAGSWKAITEESCTNLADELDRHHERMQAKQRQESAAPEGGQS